MSLVEVLRARIATSSCVWVAGVMLSVVLQVSPAQGVECRNQTPLPADVAVVPVGPAVPADFGLFSGTWSGAWLEELCTALVVEEIFPNGIARLVLSIGTSSKLDSRQPRYWRLTGRIIDHALRVHLPFPFDRDLTFRAASTRLDAIESQGATAVLHRAAIEDLRCSSMLHSSMNPLPTGMRDRLTRDELWQATLASVEPVDNGYFVPVGQTAPARHKLQGILTLAAVPMTTGHQGCRGLDSPGPGFTMEFFTEDDALVPVVRDIVGGNVILSPGRIWSEPGDGGMSRASFPFVLINPLDSVAHNGIATFLFDDEKVSALRFQIVQETAAWARYDYSGQAPLQYTPGAIRDESGARTRYALERRQRIKLEPWSSLPLPTSGDAIANFDGGIASEDVSASGLVIDGALYLRGCNTRFGPYPYCRDMRHSVYSVSKSAGASVALLRLAQKFGSAVLDLKIADYLPVSSDHDGWKDVTFADALNMAAGIGELSPQREPNDPEADESKPRMMRWVFARTARQKLDVAFSYGKYPWARGEVVRYNSTHTFVLAAAMDAFLKSREGPTANLWDMVLDEVFRPIGIMQAPALHTLEEDGSRGIPILASGLFLTIEDVAKLATFLQNGGQHEGRQLIDGSKLREALFRIEPVPGLVTGRRNRFGDERYHLSFWSIAYRTPQGCRLDIPYMAGSGGNLVVLLPNGITALRFADALDYDKEALILAVEAIRPLCPPSKIADVRDVEKRKPLAANEVRAELGGNSFYSASGRAYLDPNGVLYRDSRRAPLDVDVGRWWVSADGHFCRTWNVTDHGRTRCQWVSREGDMFVFETIDRWSVTVLRRVRGNPDGF